MRGSSTIRLMTLKQVVVADDHPLILAGVRMLLERRSDVRIVCEVHSPSELLNALEEWPADVLITDLSMPGDSETDGIPLIRRIQREHPELAVMVLTMVANSGIVGSLLELGVQALIDKASGIAELAEALDAVSVNRRYVSVSFRESLMHTKFDSRANQIAKLSPRQAEVLRLIATGMTVSAVAVKLDRSIKTVSRQKIDAMKKLGLQSDIEIFAYAREHGLG